MRQTAGKPVRVSARPGTDDAPVHRAVLAQTLRDVLGSLETVIRDEGGDPNSDRLIVRARNVLNAHHQIDERADRAEKVLDAVRAVLLSQPIYGRCTALDEALAVIEKSGVLDPAKVLR